MDSTNRIIKNPAILGGKPSIKGTRISVQIILQMMSGEMTIPDILEAYPDLEKDDVKAALQYAAKRMGCTKADLRATQKLIQQATTVVE
jgi:uncharacterized protein (DUF433 family)